MDFKQINMKKRIHVNMHHIRHNKKHGTNKPNSFSDKVMNGNVISLEEYKKAMSLE